MFAQAAKSPPQAPDELFNEAFLKKLEYLHLVSRKIFTGHQRAERRSRRTGAGIEFADHRDYVPGDDFRYLDWNIYGRMDRLLLRLFEEEQDLTIYLLLDISGSMHLSYPSKLSYAMQVAAALSYIGLSNLDRVCLITFAAGLRDRLPPARGKARIFKVFEFLRAVTPGGATRLAASLASFVHQNKRRGLAVLLSDFYDSEGYKEAVNLLRYHHFEPLLIQITDRAKEAHPPLKGDLELIDCETGEVREVTLSPRLLQAYTREYEKYCRDLADYCVSKQVSLLSADISEPFEELILALLRRGGFLR